MTARHVVQRLLDAEDLVRRRRADEYRRHAASQRAARIDPNPHQIDAVIFALARIPEGGCILADEVGLGKTIEAGLVIAQLRAEGARRVLVVTPKALLGQWKQELYALFALETREVLRDSVELAGEGVFLATRDLIGSERGAAALQQAERFDLCIIDEAHEVFAGIYRRYDGSGSVREDSRYARIAGRLSTALRATGTPVLLLTATPIQNSLLELWGLVQYVDPTGTLLGDLATFRNIFCPNDDRILEQGQAHELQRRLGTVLQRTLRRQAQEFMREPFVGRQARLFEYAMSPEERALYDDVTAYLLEPGIHAFRGKQRQLLLLGFHRRMASSLWALSASLEKVADRLRRMASARPVDDDADRAALLDDLEDDDASDAPDADDGGDDGAAPAVRAELARVESFIARARALPSDSKARAMLQAVQLVFEQARAGNASGKLVIFTESLTTQDYVRQLLLESRLVTDEDITLFRGTNDAPAALRALDRWRDDVGRKLPPDSRPSDDVAMRLALVHEFRHRSRIFISTEAGAKGLNLQFCDTVINYDLPWNPQRIEQRIGRCHRYGQQRDVTVINFLAKDNEAQRLTFDILSQKLELFGTVLGATDEVLHRPGHLAPESLASALGTELEAQLRRIYDRARTLAEVEQELRELRDTMESRRREFETAQQRTEEVIQRRFDAGIRQVFRNIQDHLPDELAAFDRHVERVVRAFLEAEGIDHTLERDAAGARLTVAASMQLPEPLREGTACVIGDPVPNGSLMPLHLGHPLVAAALGAARQAAARHATPLRIEPATGLDDLRGRRGRLRIVRVCHRNFETTEHVLPVIVLAGDGAPLAPALVAQLLDAPIRDNADAPRSGVPDHAVDDAVEEALFHHAAAAAAHDHERFEQAMDQVERFLADRVLLLERQRDLVLVKLEKAEASRDNAVGSEQRTRAETALRRAQLELESLDAELARLRAGDDEPYRRWRERAHERRYTPPEVERIFDAEIEIA